MMMQTNRTLLLAHGRRAAGTEWRTPEWLTPDWLTEAGAVLRPSGWLVHRTHTGAETIARVEEGGLSAAVLIADQAQIDGMSLLRIIRSIDGRLPCWLVVASPTRQVLEQALTLRAMSVISRPAEMDELVVALQKLALN